MDYFYDVALKQFVDASGSARTLRRLEFMRAEDLEMAITIQDNGAAYTPDGTALLTFGIKATPGESATTLALIEPGDFSEAAGGYTGTLVLNSEALSDLLSTDLSQTLYAQLSITDDSRTLKSTVIPVTMSNDIVRGDEVLGAMVPDPDTYIGARAVRYDAAQTLTDPQKAQARANIVAGMAPLLRSEIPYNRDTAPVVVTGVLTDGVSPIPLPLNPLPKTGFNTWQGESWELYNDGLGTWSLLIPAGGWLAPDGPDVENLVWLPQLTETGIPLVTPQITAGTPGQFCIVNDGANPLRFFVNAAFFAGEPEWTELPRPGYVHATHATGALELDATNAGTSRITTSTGASAFAITITPDLTYDSNNALVWIVTQGGAGVGTVGTTGITVATATTLATPGQNKTMILRQTGLNTFLLSGGAP